MKRKIFSKLLMGAFLIASVSSFVSCKDYDDDINNLQKQIDAAALKADLNALQQTLATQISAAQSAAERAQAAAEAAQATANNAATKDALEAVKTIASNAGASAAQAISDAANAKAAADAAQTTANNAGTAAEKAAADAAKAIADAAAAQSTANVATTAAAAAQKAAEVAQSAADGANTNATKALADAATALSNAAAAQESAKSAQGTADAATSAAQAGKDAAAKAQATAENAVVAAANAAAQAAEALTAAQAAQVAAAEAINSNEAIRGLLEKANKYADDAAAAALEAAKGALAASEAATAAQDAAADAKKAVAEATEAITKATDAKIAAAVAEVIANQVKVDEAQDAAEKAAVEKLEGELKNLADAQEKLATAEALGAAVTELEGKLDTAVEEAAAAATIAAVAAAAGTFEAAFDELYTGVTSVELVASFSATDFDEDVVTFPYGVSAGSISTPSVDLNFYFGKQLFDSKFGDKETESLDDDADKIITYKKDADIRTNMALLVRVNPTNATFTKDQIKFVNTKLETLDEIVEIGEPQRFTGMITRAEQQNGLWVIPVKVVDGTDFNTFNKTTFYKSSAKEWAYSDKDQYKGGYKLLKKDLDITQYDQKLYAIAINNTTDPEDAENSRYVTSTYDIAAAYLHYEPATSLDVDFDYVFNNKPAYSNISDIHNRWTDKVENGEGNVEGIRSCDQLIAYTLLNPEKIWKSPSSDEAKAGMFIPTDVPMKWTVAAKDAWNTKNASSPAQGVAGSEYRFDKPFLKVEQIGNNVKVSLPATYWTQRVEYWYISYDFELNAVESKPSEWEAWQSYQDGIEGLYKMTRGSQSIDLRINKPTADGDVIGFRVWAVNYDGSLCDPDGRAFYVKIGEDIVPEAANATVNILAVNASKGLPTDLLKAKSEDGWNVSEVTDLQNTANFESLVAESGKFGGTTTFTAAKYPKVLNSDIQIQWQILKADGTPASNWKDAKKVRAAIDGKYLKEFKNYGEVTLPLISQDRTDANNKETYTISIKFKKVMPDDAFTKKNFFDDKITWKPEAGYDAALNTLTVYPKPYSSNLGGGYVLNPHYIAATSSSSAEFWWRWNGTAASPLADFIDDATWLTWTADAANAGVRNMYDYISKPETTDAFPRDLYKFEFKGLPTELVAGVNAPAGAPANKDYVTEWDKTATNMSGDKAVVAVRSSAVRNEGTYTTNLKYTYENISLTRKGDDSGWDTAAGYDWVCNATTFQTDFKDALDLVSYGTEIEYLKYDNWQKNSIDIPVITSSPVLKDDKVYIAWRGGNGTFDWFHAAAETQNAAELFQLALDDHSVAGGTPVINSQEFVASTYKKDYTIHTALTNDLTTLLQPTITTAQWTLAQGALVGTNYTGAGLDDYHFVKAHYEFDNPATPADETGTIKVELKGQVAKYLKIAAGSTVDAIIFEKISGIASPTQNWDGTIEITGYDVFGKGHTYQIPVVLLYNF